MASTQARTAPTATSRPGEPTQEGLEALCRIKEGPMLEAPSLLRQEGNSKAVPSDIDDDAHAFCIHCQPCTYGLRL